MSDHDDNSLTARLGVQRLAMPGVLDRTPVQRRSERLQQGTVKHELSEQLHRRATASGEAAGSSFVWRRSPERADATAEGLPVSAATTSVPVASSSPISRTSSPVVQRATLPGAESAAVTERLTSRAQSPGVVAAGSTISRAPATGSFGNAPAFAAHLQSRYGVTSSEAAAAAAPVQAVPAPSISRAPAGVVRRQADAATSTAPPTSHETASVVPALSPVSHGHAAAPMLARKAPAASAMASPMARAMASTLSPAGTGSPAAPDSTHSRLTTGTWHSNDARGASAAVGGIGGRRPAGLAAHAGGAGAIELAVYRVSCRRQWSNCHVKRHRRRCNRSPTRPWR